MKGVHISTNILGPYAEFPFWSLKYWELYEWGLEWVIIHLLSCILIAFCEENYPFPTNP